VVSRKPSSELAKLWNLGEVSARALNAVGIHTEAELREVGAVNAYRLLVLRGHKPSLNYLWAIEGALRGINWLRIPPADRERLKRRSPRPSTPGACSASTDRHRSSPDPHLVPAGPSDPHRPSRSATSSSALS
jgi:hypothetical protein